MLKKVTSCGAAILVLLPFFIVMLMSILGLSSEIRVRLFSSLIKKLFYCTGFSRSDSALFFTCLTI